MEEVQLHQEPSDLWMECEEEMGQRGEEQENEEQQLRIVPKHTGPAEEISLSQSSSVKCAAAPPAFKVNGSLIQKLPPTGVQLQLSFHPKGSSSGFTRILLPDTIPSSSSSSPPAHAPQPLFPAAAPAPLSIPIITGVVSGEAAYRVLNNHSEAAPLTHVRTPPPHQPLSPLTRPAVPHRLLLKGQMKTFSPPSNCSTCSSSYKLVPELRGFLCLCSPVITQSLRNMSRRRRKRNSRDFHPARTGTRPRPGSGVGPQPRLRPSPGAGPSPGRGTGPRPVAGPQQGAVGGTAHRLPLVETQQTGLSFPASSAPSCISPEDLLSERVQEDHTALEPQQSKLVIMVEDFYYGSAPGQEPINQIPGAKGRRHQGPYSCIYCPETLSDNIQLMTHMMGHVTSQDSQHTSAPSCSHCFRPFLSFFRLQRHLEAVHGPKSEVTAAQCQICELAFDNEPTFLRHMKTTHKPGEMPYACQVCGFRSSFHSQVYSHFEQCHSATGLLLCLYCLRVLSSSNCYQQHVARHQRKQVFSCRKCRLHFLFVRERVEHLRMHHGTHVRPPQLSRLRPGTKVTVRTYSVVGVPIHRSSMKRPEPCKVVDMDPPPHTQEVKSGPLVQSLGPLLTKLEHYSAPQQCVECLSRILDFSSHFPSLVRCSVCRFLTCCSTAYANHMINHHATKRPESHFCSVFQSKPRLSHRPLLCVMCSLSTHRGDLMANHLAEQPDHRCLLLASPEYDRSRTTSLQEDSLLNPGGGAFVPIHQLLPHGGSAQLSVKPLLPQTPSCPAMLVQVLGPRLLSEQDPPLSIPQLWVLVLALTLGTRQVCRQSGVTPSLLRSWLTKLKKGGRPWVTKGRVLPGEAWPWKTGRLAQWLLVQREQQQQASPEVLLEVAQTLLGRHSPISHQLAWTAHFLLRHDLALEPLEALDVLETPDLEPLDISNLEPLETTDLDPQHSPSLAIRGRLPKIVLDRSRAFIHLLALEMQNHSHPPHLLACMAELSVWVDVVKFSKQDPGALRLIGAPGEKPVFSLVLAGLADGTFLPPLLFFSGFLPPLPDGFPDNILLEACPQGLEDQDLHRTWIHRVWRPHLDSQQSSMWLLLDIHRGHLTEEFRSSVTSSTNLLFIPSACSNRLNPLQLCVIPAFRDFLATRWFQLASQGGLDGLGLDQLSLTLACWLSELSSTLHTGTYFLQRSFSIVSRQEVLEDRSEAASMTQALLDALQAPPPPTGPTH